MGTKADFMQSELSIFKICLNPEPFKVRLKLFLIKRCPSNLVCLGALNQFHF